MKDYRPAPDLLQDRVILVTGAGSGIGRAVATAYAAHGATLVLLGPVLRELEATYDAIEQAGHPQPAIFEMDLAEAGPAEVHGMAASIGQHLGRLDGLVHNAALLPYLSRIDDYDPEDWERVLRINLTAPFLLTQACLPLLRQAPDASILFTTDKVGRRGRAYWGAYGVSKAGLDNLMQILADETEKDGRIRANAIDPGPVRSDLRIRIYPAQDPSTWAAPEDILGPYLFLMGPDSAGVTGRIWPPDGKMP